MEYRVKVSKEAKTEISKLETKLQIRIYNKLESIRFSPHSFLERYAGSDLWKLRIGDYRAIIEMNEKNKSIEVITAGHRKNIYKKK